MRTKGLKIMTIFLMLFTFTFVGLLNVEAAESSIKVKTQRKGYKDGKSYYDANIRLTTDGDYAYCMNHDDNAPVFNKAIKCQTVHASGPILYILNNTSIAGTETKNKNEGPVIIRQKALWRYLNHIGAGDKGQNDNKYSKITGKEKAKAQKLYDAALKQKNYTVNPKLSTTKSVELKLSGTKFVGTVKVSMTDVTDNSYSVSLPTGLSGAKVTDKTSTSFKIEMPATSVSKKITNQTVTVTGKSSPHRYVKQCHYNNSTQDMGILVKAKNVAPKDTTTISVNPPTCTVVGTVYYGKSGTSVSQTTYYKECNPKCTTKDGKYYDNNGKPVTQAEYYKACNPKCAYKDGKYYDKDGKPVTQAEYYNICNPKCTEKDGKYYNKVGAPVTQAEYYKDCNPKCQVKDGKYYDSNGKPVTQTEYYKICNPKCVEDNGKYYDNNGKPVTQAEYYKACNPMCTYKDGKYYDNAGKPVSETEYYAICNPKCVEKDGKYYDNNGKPVTQTEYYSVCNPKCEIKDGKYYDNNGKPVSQTEYYNICNPKCKYEDGKYYDKTGKPVTQEQYFDSCFDPTPNPDPVKEVDTTIIRYEKDYHYTIKHEVPYRSTANHYKSYVFTDVLEEPLQIKNVEDVKIYQTTVNSDTKDDWTSKFDVKISGQTITATLKNPNEAAFYGTRSVDGTEINKVYSYVLTVSLKKDAETKYDMTKYLTDEGYVIPDVANIEMVKADGSKENQPTNKVEVLYTFTPAPTKSVDQFDQTESYLKGTEYTYTITKQVLKYEGSQKYKSFVFVDEFEPPIKMTSTEKLTIKNEAGEDVTSWFNITLKGQKLTATLKDEYNKNAFYGHVYYFNATVQLRQGYNLTNYSEGNKKYVIPNHATFTTDDQIEKTDVVKVFVQIQEKEIPAPDTASAASIVGITGGIILVLGAGYAMAVKSGIDPLGSYLKANKAGKSTKK